MAALQWSGLPAFSSDSQRPLPPALATTTIHTRWPRGLNVKQLLMKRDIPHDTSRPPRRPTAKHTTQVATAATSTSSCSLRTRLLRGAVTSGCPSGGAARPPARAPRSAPPQRRATSVDASQPRTPHTPVRSEASARGPARGRCRRAAAAPCAGCAPGAPPAPRGTSAEQMGSGVAQCRGRGGTGK